MNLKALPEAFSSNGMKLYLVGFVTLFLELILIRYLAGNIWNMGYFPNLVLLAVFIGMGIGFIFHQRFSNRSSTVLYHASQFALLALIGFVYLAHPVVPGFNQWQAEIGGELYYSNTPVAADKISYIHFGICFVGIIIIFALISQRAGKLFRQMKPLTAYSLDIAGSCSGIVTFMILSFLQCPAYAWFVIFLIIILLSMPDSWKTRWIPVLPCALMIFSAYVQDTRLLSNPNYSGKIEVRWSPYQKIEYAGGIVYVNGIAHQEIAADMTHGSLYLIPYMHRKENASLSPYRDVLVLGAGVGNDVAAAIQSEVVRIDAVEIDPVIAQLGWKYHPLHPYDYPGVSLIIEDGRAFMTRTTHKYDLILFALTDSMVKASPVSQLRLENYLFTKEAVKKAYSLLSETGDIVFYNFYRQPWLIARVRDLIYEATGKVPVISQFHSGEVTYFSVGKFTESETIPGADRTRFDTPVDDWPFLYLKYKGLPAIYRNAMILMWCFAIFLIIALQLSAPKNDSYRGARTLFAKLAFLFMGAAFLLLETKSVIQFSLLFGTTWLNNSLVFLAVLISVLAANWTATLIKARGKLLIIIYFLLMVSALSSLVYPIGNLLGVKSFLLRFAVASILTFTPVYFANLIFSFAFKDVDVPEHIFGWNLIGAAIGGIMEYLSMAFGYNFLAIIVASCYTAVILLLVISNSEKESIKCEG